MDLPRNAKLKNVKANRCINMQRPKSRKANTCNSEMCGFASIGSCRDDLLLDRHPMRGASGWLLLWSMGFLIQNGMKMTK